MVANTLLKVLPTRMVVRRYWGAESHPLKAAASAGFWEISFLTRGRDSEISAVSAAEKKKAVTKKNTHKKICQSGKVIWEIPPGGISPTPLRADSAV